MKETHIADEEINAMEKEAAELDSSLITFELSKPFEYEGKTYKKLQFDFDKLTGHDSLEIERELTQSNIPLLVPSVNGAYLIRVAARACTERVGYDMLEALPLREYNAIRGLTRNFLNHVG